MMSLPHGTSLDERRPEPIWPGEVVVYHAEFLAISSRESICSVCCGCLPMYPSYKMFMGTGKST